jgi:site-specific DNA recombinase
VGGKRSLGRARSTYQEASIGDTSPTASPHATILRFAWVGRVSTRDMQDPTLSLPRQLNVSRRALPEDAVIVANFYDVESGRMYIDIRGRGHAHEQFEIPINRDGGIQDLWAHPPVVSAEEFVATNRRTRLATALPATETSVAGSTGRKAA